MSLTAQAVEIALLSFGLSLASSLLRRFTFSKEDMMLMAEAQRFQREMLRAVREKDSKALSRLEKQKDYYQRVQGRLMGKNLALMFATMALYLGFFSWAAGHYGDVMVLRVPEGFAVPLLTAEGGMTWFGWYFLTALAFGTLLNRVINPMPVLEQRPPAKRPG